MEYDVVYESNGKPAGDRLGTVRISQKGQRLELLVDPKTERFVALKLRPVAGGEEPAPDPDPVPDPDPNPEPDPDPVPDSQPDPDPVPDPDPAPDPDPTPQPDADYVVGAGGDVASIGAAIAAVPSGSVVMVRAGTYREGTIQISRDHIHVYGEPGAVLDSTARSWNAITVTGNYVTIEGLEIKNAAQDGIEFNNCHHGTVRRCHIHHCGESGIQTNYGDFWTFEENHIHDCASTGWFSGISLYQNRNITGDATPGVRNVLRANTCYENVTESGRHTDGNGIIIDDFRNTQNNSPAGIYAFGTLVEDNILYANGGMGIQVFYSDHVTARRNVSYKNGQDPAYEGTWRGELSNSFASDCAWVDNVAVADPSAPGRGTNCAILNTSAGGRNSGITYDGNTTWNGRAGEASLNLDGGNAAPPAASNRLGVRPEFVDEAGRDFRLVGAD